MIYEPQLPQMTMAELRENDSLSFDIVMTVVRHAALQLYRANPATYQMGLEKCEEAILQMLDEGTAKLMWDETEDDPGDDMVWVGYFNSATGKYQPPAFACNDED
jgi:hypothetical protein